MTTTSTPFTLRLSWARGLFDRGDHIAAATALAELVAELEQPARASAADTEIVDIAVPTTELRLLLARAYFHSAQLGKAEAVLRDLVVEAPTDGYAHLLLGRTLQRAGRHAEAARPLALAEAFGDYERPTAYAATARAVTEGAASATSAAAGDTTAT